MEWRAFEHVYGPILVHDRVDIGLAKLSYYIASLFTDRRRKVKFRDFLPTYLRELMKQRESSSADDLRAFFEGLARANDQHPHR